jgi:phosphoenolpyruvate carboxykinase (GTP)
MAELLAVDTAGWQDALSQVREYYAQFGDRLPAELIRQLDALESRLS